MSGYSTISGGPRSVPFLFFEAPGRQQIVQFTPQQYNYLAQLPQEAAFIRLIPITFSFSFQKRHSKEIDDDIGINIFGIALRRGGSLLTPRITEDVNTQSLLQKLNSLRSLSADEPNIVEQDDVRFGPVFECELDFGVNAFELWSTGQGKVTQCSHMIFYRGN
jgi:hypothetical protein